jgi:hypothetical protein
LTLALREACRLTVFENSVLRRMFRQKRNEMVAGWRKVHKEELKKVTLRQVQLE